MIWRILLIIIMLLGGGSFVVWLFGERWHLRLNSTYRWFSSNHWSVRGRGFRPVHGYIYMRWQNQYIQYVVRGMGKISPPFVRRYFQQHYHAKVLPQAEAEALIQVKEPIQRRDLEQIVPYENARDFLMEVPPEIIVYECGCRNSRAEHCEPTQVCMWIGQPYVDFILEHNPQSARRISRDEALDLLRAEHERGHVHTAWFKDAMQDRFYCICNCCSCCCAGIEAMKKYGTKFIASSGYRAEIDSEACQVCGNCAEICPFDAVHRVNGSYQIDEETCEGCGVCVDQCPAHAIRLLRDERKGIPFDVRTLQNNPVGHETQSEKSDCNISSLNRKSAFLEGEFQ